MKESVKSTQVYKESTYLVSQLTQLMIFLNTEPDLETLTENKWRLDEIEAQLTGMVELLESAKKELDEAQALYVITTSIGELTLD